MNDVIIGAILSMPIGLYVVLITTRLLEFRSWLREYYIKVISAQRCGTVYMEEITLAHVHCVIQFQLSGHNKAAELISWIYSMYIDNLTPSEKTIHAYANLIMLATPTWRHIFRFWNWKR